MYSVIWALNTDNMVLTKTTQMLMMIK